MPRRSNLDYLSHKNDLIDPATGQLRDFEPTHGDEKYAHHVMSNPRRWGRRVLLAADQSPTRGAVKFQATLIETGDLGRSFPVDVQLRFALNGFAGPVLPFSNAFPNVPDVLTVKVRRGTDPVAPVTEDIFTIDQTVFATLDVLPFDIIPTRSLGLDVTLTGTSTTQIWMEAIASEVTEISTQNKIIAYQQAVSSFVPAVATPANANLVIGAAKRVQFVVVNTSTNADLIIRFGAGATWGGVGPGGTIVLPKNIFATYESPIGGYGGLVTGSWNDPAPNGGAIVTRGSYW